MEKHQSKRPWGSSAAAVLRAQSRAAGAVQGAVGGADTDKPVVFEARQARDDYLFAGLTRRQLANLL